MLLTCHLRSYLWSDLARFTALCSLPQTLIFFFYYDTDTETAVTLLFVHLFLLCINPALEALSTGKRLRSTPSAVLLLQVQAPELRAVAVLGEELILH